MSRSIIRRDERGDPDDIVIDDVTCFRMERMSQRGWWLAAYRGDERVAFWLSSKKPIAISVEDGFGCVDDSMPMSELYSGIGDNEGTP